MTLSVLVAGASGFVGQHLARVLAKDGYDVICVSRDPEGSGVKSKYFHSVLSWENIIYDGLPPCDAVINLAGENVMQISRRWTDAYRKDVLSSRVNSTKRLAELITASTHKPSAFITASGVGYYEPSSTVDYDEHSSGGRHDFLAEVSTAWEDASKLPDSLGVRVVNVRTGAVLGKSGGVIKNLYWPFFFGFGGTVGSGEQPFPWIHLDDLVHIYKYTMENKQCTGVYNGVAPQIITNADFTKAFAKSMHRPAFFPTPAFILDGILGSERSSILTKGQRVHPKRVLDAGFGFLFPTIQEACDDICAPDVENYV